FTLLAALPLTAGCPSSSPSSPAGSSARPVTVKPDAPKPAGEPIVRVRIGERAESITITAPFKVQVHAVDRVDQKVLVNTPVTIQRIGGHWSGPWTINPPESKAELVITPLGPSPLVVDKQAYPGSMRLVPVA